ncbi:MAG: hypothetical protein PHF86_08040 [Candidatus Nanoarchaeia archaeon]|nr:hypothetical protein [Candidatus Nanoarchaeia archaeon]
MDKKFIVLLLICSILFIGASCQTGTNTNTQGVFISGIKGIDISFKETAPVSEFQQKDSVPVVLILKNLGGYDLGAGSAKAKLFGVNLDNFGITTKTYKGTSLPLKGVSTLNPEGSEQEVNFGNMNYKLEVPGESVPYTFKAKVCYPYETKTYVNVCMRSKELEKEVGCALAEGKNGERIKSGDVSAGPIQVTSITEETRGNNQVKFAIKIENKGNGKVYAINSDCETMDKDTIKKLDSENKITYEITNPVGIQCGSAETNKGEVTLVNNVYTLNCWKTIDSVYEDKLNIKLDYVYISDTSKDIKIFKTL